MAINNAGKSSAEPRLGVKLGGIGQSEVGKDIPAACDDLSRFRFRHTAAGCIDQYFCTLGSISSDQARMPPARLTTLE